MPPTAFNTRWTRQLPLHGSPGAAMHRKQTSTPLALTPVPAPAAAAGPPAAGPPALAARGRPTPGRRLPRRRRRRPRRCPPPRSCSRHHCLAQARRSQPASACESADVSRAPSSLCFMGGCGALPPCKPRTQAKRMSAHMCTHKFTSHMSSHTSVGPYVRAPGMRRACPPCPPGRSSKAQGGRPPVRV